MADLFVDIGIVIIIAAIGAYLAKLLKQPLILAYMVAGIVIGPQFLGLIKDHASIETLSALGIVFLLFIVGLELDVRKLKNVGSVSIIAGIGQIIFTFILGFFIAKAFGFSSLVSYIISAALTFSSTVIVVKLYSDKNEINTLHGRIALGILLIQDLVAVLALVFLQSFSDVNGSDILTTTLITILRGIILFVIAITASYLLKHLFKRIAQSQELLFLASIAWLFLFALIASSLKFSIAIGSFLAGISLAILPYNLEIIGKTRSLRDFFATIFFVSLGMQITFSDIGGLILPAIILSLFVLIGNPLITMIPMSLLGYTSRVSFLTSVSIAQISEFSLILIVLASQLGYVTKEVVSLIALIAVITITLSTYAIIYDDGLYKKLKFLKIFDKLSKKQKSLKYTPSKDYPTILFGYNRIGYSIVSKLKRMNKGLLIVDYNPDLINKLIAEKRPCIYGDASDPEILSRINFKKARLIVSTVPNKEDNLLLLKKAKSVNKKTIAFLTASQIDEALELYDAGADYVILPHFLGGEYVSVLIEKLGFKPEKIFSHKAKHIKELEARKLIGHEHPR